IGLNGSGKSTVLQFIDFLAQQVRGGLQDWLDERGWKSSGVLTQFGFAKIVKFTVKLVDRQKEDIEWKAVFNPSRMKCTSEFLKTPDAELQVKDSKYSIKSEGTEVVSGEIPFKFEGSI